MSLSMGDSMIFKDGSGQNINHMQPSLGFYSKEEDWGITDYISALFHSFISLFIEGPRLSVVKVNIPEKDSSTGALSMKSHYFLGQTTRLNSYIDTFQKYVKDYNITDHLCLVGREITIARAS